MSRRSEIEAKRAKIAELQRLREQRLASASSTTHNNIKVPLPAARDKESIDNLVDSLLAGRVGSPDIESVSSDRAESRGPRESSERAEPVEFDTVITQIFDVPPISRPETVTYSKGVQTTEPWEELPLPPSTPVLERNEKHLETTPHATTETHATDTNDQITPQKPQINIMGKEKLEEIQRNKEYTHFIDQSLKVISRALQPDYDILTDYGAMSTQEAKGDQLITQKWQFFSDYSKGRAITYLDWSTRYPELLASAHTEKNSDPNAPKGLVQIWNLNARSRPEYVLDANTDVLTVQFYPFESNLVFGTGYNGQVISWDLRAGSHPILTSPLTGTGHTHPAFSMCLSGTQNANSLITASTDGVVCTWTPDILVKPQDRLFLESPFGTRLEEVAPTALAVSPRDPTLFLVGTEKGNILQCNKFAQAGHKAGIDPRAYYSGHLSPITSMDFHTSRGLLDLSNYMLTSGLDWSIKLWKVRPFTGAVPTSSHGSYSTQAECYEPILDLKRDDSVYDVSWHPNHPSIFANVDGQGYLDVWDLGKDSELPIIREKPQNQPGTLDSGSNYLGRPLNRLVWEPSGEKIAVGGLDGIVTIFELEPSLVLVPPAEDWNTFKRKLAQLEEA
jgi:dynein intermediate chain, cytosolic